MALTIGLATLAGKRLDQYFNSKPMFMASLAVLSVVGVMISVIRSLTKMTQESEQDTIPQDLPQSNKQPEKEERGEFDEIMMDH